MIGELITKFRRSFLLIRCRKDGDFIEILNSYPVKTAINEPLGVALVVIAILAGVMIVAIIAAEEDNIIAGLIAITFCICLLVAGIKLCAVTEETNRKEYQVLLDEKYPAKDLISKYEIVKQEGKILYLRDKEGDS